MLIAVKFLANINHNFLLSIIYCIDFSEKILQAMFKDIPKKEIAATFASVGDVNMAAELLLLKKCKILISFCHLSDTRWPVSCFQGSCILLVVALYDPVLLSIHFNI